MHAMGSWFSLAVALFACSPPGPAAKPDAGAGTSAKREQQKEELERAQRCHDEGVKARREWQFDSAEESFRCAVAIRHKYHNDSYRPLIESRFGLAEILILECRLDEARRLLTAVHGAALSANLSGAVIPGAELWLAFVDQQGGNTRGANDWVRASAGHCAKDALMCVWSHLGMISELELGRFEHRITDVILLRELHRLRAGYARQFNVLALHELYLRQRDYESARRLAQAEAITIRDEAPWPEGPLEAPAAACVRPLTAAEAEARSEADERALLPIAACIDRLPVPDGAHPPALLAGFLFRADGSTAAVHLAGLSLSPDTFVCALRTARTVHLTPIESGFRIDHSLLRPRTRANANGG